MTSFVFFNYRIRKALSPLDNFINSLLRIRSPTPSSSKTESLPHPLHTLLTPLLLPPHYASTKYRDELRQILVDGGGAGEQEESMMWFVWAKAKRSVKEGVEEEEDDEDAEGVVDRSS